MSVFVDTYGKLAPEPAASRLFVPYERSSNVRGAVTRAFILHATKLLKANPNSEDWTEWYAGFVESWNPDELAIGLDNADLKSLHTEMGGDLGLRAPRKQFAKLLAARHSHFGRNLLARIKSGQTPSQEDITKAVESVKLPAEQIDETVKSLSEHLGWDVTQTPSF